LAFVLELHSESTGHYSRRARNGEAVGEMKPENLTNSGSGDSASSISPALAAVQQFRLLRAEIAAFDPTILEKPHAIILHKADCVVDAEQQRRAFLEALYGMGTIRQAAPAVILTSIVSGAGLDDLKHLMRHLCPHDGL
jgi:hypothetical protein